MRVTWNFRAYESSFFRLEDNGNLPLILNVQIRGEVVSSYLRHAHAHIHLCTHICAPLFSSRWGRRGWANPLSNSNLSRFPPAVDRVKWQARNVVIAEIMVMPTVRRGEQNGGGYITLKFNSAIVPRTRGTRGTESEGTLMLFRKTPAPPTNARHKESSRNSRANSWGVM